MDPARTELLVRLLSRHQAELFRHVFALLPHEEDARDVLQETSVALFRKFDTYDPDRPFLPWAYHFARLEVLKFREKNRGRGVGFGPELVEVLAREREDSEPLREERLRALEHCLRELPDADRELVRRRYQGGIPIDALVAAAGTSRRTLFRSLDRIRQRLLTCITGRTAKD